MRVALVSPYGLGVPGGVQQQVIELAAWLELNGHSCIVFAPDAVEHGVDLGSTVRWRANGAVAPIHLRPAVLQSLPKQLAEYDVVHLHEPFMPAVGWAALRTEAPLVATFHADPSDLVRRTYRVARGIVNRSLGDAVVTAVSLTAASTISWLEPAIIPNALDVDGYRSDVEKQRSQVAFLGRPDPRKGRDVLLDAWPQVRAAVPSAELVVMGAGGGPELPGVTYAGQVSESEKRAVLAESGVFCAPNRGGESFGITVAEGMAAGCAIAASDISAFTDLLDGTGRLFSNGDADQLASVLIELLSDHDAQQTRAAMSSARIDGFDWDAVGVRYVECYESARS